jgi:hypothetical protein
MILKKTINEILEDWDEYKNKHIKVEEDWKEEHDIYLNTEWTNVKQQKDVWNNFIENNHFSICESGDHNMVDIMTMKDLKILKEMLFGRN